MHKKELKQMENLRKNRKNVLLKDFEKRSEKYQAAGTERATYIAVAEEDAREPK